MTREGIAEHWGDGHPLAHFDSHLTVTVPAGSSGREVVEFVTLERRTYPPGSVEVLAAGRFALVVVEAGDLRFVGDRIGAGYVRRIAVGATDAVRSTGADRPGGGRGGRSRRCPPPRCRSGGELRNVGAQEAVALVVVARDAPARDADSDRPDTSGPREARPVSGSWSGSPAAGPRTELLAGGPRVALPAGDAVVAIGRAILPTGSVAPHPVGGAEVVTVEAGGLIMEAGGDGAWVRRGASGRSTLLETALLDVGEGALVGAGATVRYRGSEDAPLALLLVTISLA